ncbi:hypothetical protein RYX36_002697 [Vicia faba]
MARRKHSLYAPQLLHQISSENSLDLAEESNEGRQKLKLVMLLWNYFSVVFIDPRSLLSNWKPTIDKEIGEEDPLVGVGLMNMMSDPSNQRIWYCKSLTISSRLDAIIDQFD